MVIVSVGLKVSAMVAQQQIRYGLTQVTLTNPDQFLCAFLRELKVGGLDYDPLLLIGGLTFSKT